MQDLPFLAACDTVPPVGREIRLLPGTAETSSVLSCHPTIAGPSMPDLEGAAVEVTPPRRAAIMAHVSHI